LLRKEKEGGCREDGAHRTLPRRFLLVLVTIILLTPFYGVYAAAQITSGTTHLSNTLQYGVTVYSVDYSYPSTAEVGSNLTISVTLHVNSLTELVEYVNDFRLVANVYVGPQLVLNGSIAGGGKPLFLHPGSTLGPIGISIPLTARNTGVAEGASANATVSVTLVDTIWVARPLVGPASGDYYTEPAMQGAAGALVIHNAVASTNSSTGQGTVQTILPYALLVSGAALVLLFVFFPRGPRSPQTNQK
jgi:hypothetical protein